MGLEEDRQLLNLTALRLEAELSETYATPRSYGWLGEHGDEAAELAALLHEAAPKLVLASLRAPVAGARPLPKARSYEVSATIKDRLRAAEPMSTGPGQVPWSRLAASISSELLKFDEVSDTAATAARTQAAAAAAQSPSSPRSLPGDMLEINSGGRVFFCLFDAASPAPTPPCSLRNSPERDGERYMGRAGAANGKQCEGDDIWGQQAQEPSLLVRGGGGSPHKLLRSVEEGRKEAGSAHSGSDHAAATKKQLRELQVAAVRQDRHSGSSSSPSAGSSDSQDLSGILQCSGTSFTFASAPVAAVVAGDAPPAMPRRLCRFPTVGGGQTCLVLKFVSSRLLCQSEQFASELTRHVGLCAPDSRILRSKGTSEGEWQEALEAAAALRDRFPDLYEEMGRNSCCLVMEFIPGSCLFKSGAAFCAPHLHQTAEDLGRLFTLDMLLGNADRLHCDELSWRGNPENILYAAAGRWAGRVVPIDAVVQRRPPGGLVSVEDRSCERLAELALNDAGVASTLLRQAVQPAEGAAKLTCLPETAAAFQLGLKAALDATVSIKGLLEMMFEVVTDWIQGFIEDIEEGGPLAATHHSGGGSSQPSTTPRSMCVPSSRRVSSAGGTTTSPLLLSTSASTSCQTMRIRQISHEAQHNDSVGEKVAHWKGVFREKGEELRAAVEEWQQKRGMPAGGQRLTTAFLDGTHPIVDVYELKVRLAHMLQRLRVLQQATLTGRPCRLMPRLYLSGAVEASSHHLLKHMGVSHVLNATEDLLLPEEVHGFVTMRCPLRDLEEEDLLPFLPDATAFIDEGLAKGSSLLVHCHAGKSRSCSLVLAWLMTRRRWPLNRAMDFLQRARPEAAPNAGYLAALLRLEEELFGRQTVKMKKTKPEPRTCPECGEKVGLSTDSVRVHLRFKHPGSALVRSLQDSQDGSSMGGRGGSGTWAELAGSSPASSRPHSLAMGQLSSPSSLSGGVGSGTFSPRSSIDAGVTPRHTWHNRQSPKGCQSQQQQQQQYQEVEAGADKEQQQVRPWQWRQHGRASPPPPQPRSLASSPEAPAAPALDRWAVAPAELDSATLTAWLTVPRGASRSSALAEGYEEYLDSPISMAAALQGEVGKLSLCAGDEEEEEEYLSAGITPHQPF